MSRRRGLAALAAGVLAGGFAAALVATGAAAQENADLRIKAVDARSFPVVEVLVAPPPTLYGVVPDSVILLENGTSRPATVGLLAEQPLTVLLVVDTSGSMRGAPLEAAKLAAAGFLEALPPTTRTAVMGFAGTPLLAGDFSDDPGNAAAALRRLEAAGETALYDAVFAAVDALAAAGEGRPFIVLLSDGGDTASNLSLAEALDHLEASDVRFYAVGLQTDESDPASLEALAEVGAGRAVSAEDPAALADMYDLIASELVNQLVIGYTSAGGGPTDLSITISHRGVSAAVTASITLPGTPPATTTTIPAATTTTRPGHETGGATATTLPPAPPEPYVASGPGLFAAPWVLPVGLAAMGLAALTVLILALWPKDRPRNQWVATVRERFTPSGGLLTRITNRAKGAAETALTRSGRRSGLSRALDGAGIRLAAGEFLIISMSAGAAGAAAGTLLFRVPGALILGGLGLVVPRLLVNRTRRKRRDAFAAQLDGTLQLLSGSMRAGYGLLQSVNNISAEAAAPTGEEFGRIIMETRLGRDLVESLHALADRMDSDDFRWVVQAIDIQRSVGGDLAEILDTVGQTIRERNQIRRQIKALSAEGRISAYILIAIPFALAAFIMMMAPEYIAPLWTTTAGKMAVAVGGMLMLTGVVWIRRLIRLRF
jgi:tight adherence protein B